jgi:hypothetical protein
MTLKMAPNCEDQKEPRGLGAEDVFSGVTTKALNHAIRRNADRFPSDFMFCLIKNEKHAVVANCAHEQVSSHQLTVPISWLLALRRANLRSDTACASGPVTAQKPKPYSRRG